RMSPPRQEAVDGKLMEPQNDASTGFIRLVESFTMIFEKGIFSYDTIVLGQRWALALKKNASTYLGVYLYHPTYETRPWSVDVSTHLKLVGTGNGGNREF
ncbi:hypothetical protein PMAYCL1PPCAC_05437, partial [Pristionchus mayeri]